jgi:hypothetical protein
MIVEKSESLLQWLLNQEPIIRVENGILYRLTHIYTQSEFIGKNKIRTKYFWRKSQIS